MVMQMMQNIRENLHDTEDDEELEAYLKKTAARRSILTAKA